MPHESSDAPVIQLESRKLCLSILFGTRKNKVACATNPVPQLPDIIQLESRRKFLGITPLRQEVIPRAIFS
jgi:hypothetical protein